MLMAKLLSIKLYAIFWSGHPGHPDVPSIPSPKYRLGIPVEEIFRYWYKVRYLQWCVCLVYLRYDECCVYCACLCCIINRWVVILCYFAFQRSKMNVHDYEGLGWLLLLWHPMYDTTLLVLIFLWDKNKFFFNKTDGLLGFQLKKMGLGKNSFLH